MRTFKSVGAIASAVVVCVLWSGCSLWEEEFQPEVIAIARDLEVLYQSEIYFPESDIRQGRQLSHGVVDVEIDPTGANGQDVYVVFQETLKSFGSFSGSERYSYEVFIGRAGASAWERISLGYKSANGQNHKLMGLAVRDGRALQVVLETDCHLGGCGGSEGGYRVYRFTDIPRQKIVGTEPPLFADVPVAFDGWIGGGFIDSYDPITMAPLYGARRVKADSRALLVEEEGSGWLPGATSLDGASWSGVKYPLLNGWNGEDEYRTSVCRTHGGEPTCIAPADWPTVLEAAFVHAFADGTLAFIGERAGAIHLLPFDDELRYDSFAELPGHHLGTFARRSALHPRYGGALPIDDGANGINHFVRLLDRRDGAWEEILVPTDICKSPPCEERLRPALVAASPLGMNEGKEEWLLLLSLQLEAWVPTEDGDKILGTRYHLYSTRRAVERRPFPGVLEGFELRHLVGPSSAPAAPLDAVCHARRSCSDVIEDNCYGWWKEADPACPDVAALLSLATSGGGSCEEWLAPSLDETCRHAPAAACGPETGKWSYCDGSLRTYCFQLNRDEFFGGVQDCSLIGLECRKGSDAFDAVCMVDDPEPGQQPRHTDWPTCHQGRYLSWSAGEGRVRHWLDCRELGFEGCAPAGRRFGTPKCVSGE